MAHVDVPGGWRLDGEHEPVTPAGVERLTPTVPAKPGGASTATLTNPDWSGARESPVGFVESVKSTGCEVRVIWNASVKVPLTGMKCASRAVAETSTFRNPKVLSFHMLKYDWSRVPPTASWPFPPVPTIAMTWPHAPAGAMHSGWNRLSSAQVSRFDRW